MATPLQPTGRDPRKQDDNTSEDEMMPLLFMDNLPSDFKRNAQLAALVTFMGSDEDDDADHDECMARATTTTNNTKKNRRMARAKARLPYARHADTTVGDPEKATEKKKNKKKESGSSTQELQLYLSMFKLSSKDE